MTGRDPQGLGVVGDCDLGWLVGWEASSGREHLS